MKGNSVKIALVALIGGLVILFFAFDLHHQLSLENIKSKQQAFEHYYAGHRVRTVATYMLGYIIVTALSLPGAAVMSLAGGALFGLWAGVLMVSFASSIGATLAFLVSRFLFRDYVQGKFGDKLRSINAGMRKEGAFYLFTLRLVPVFPFFVINLAMGLTSIRTAAFYLVSQVGMLPGTFVYLNAGTQLGKIESAQGILSPGLIFSFVLLGAFPLIAKRAVSFVKARKALSRFTRPKKFDYNLIVIGAGSAGLVTSYIAATVRAKVALIEKHRMGGDCLNTGCVPSKALIRSAKMLSYAKRSQTFGFRKGDIEFSFGDVMERVQRIIKKIEPHDSVQRYTALGVDCIDGEARIESPYTVAVNGNLITTRAIVIATGACPFIPPVKGLNQAPYLTSDTVWDIRELPRRLVVLGGGPIGCELAQAFGRFGAAVTQVEMGSQIMGREDAEIAAAIQKRFEQEGIKVLTRHRAKEVVCDGDGRYLICEHDGRNVKLDFDQILVAVGRAANVTGFGLEELGVELTAGKTVAVNEFLQTNFPNIYCAGDVAGPYQFTHFAAHQAWYAGVNALFGGIKRFRTDYRVIPWATFTDPEVARVGLNEREAQEKNIAYEKVVYGIDDLDRAIADSEDHGMVKVLTRPKSDKILGVTIMGAHASDIIAEYVFAMKNGLGLNKILETIHIYPTLAEANKYAAGEWKKAHAPENILRWLNRYHHWMRG
jgi:pyruvate/2-oxoglutarate dehydrogenase complex dihydrolipoamide dehydrogenase (E3) component/uncharacterized membrane protein YdjX (TVP38/TMEM64 family)